MKMKVRTIIVSFLYVLVAINLSDCCCKKPINQDQPPPSGPVATATPGWVYVQCRHQEVQKIKDCLISCRSVAEADRTICNEGCRGRINQVEGCDADREALRKCFPECVVDN
jgi:hypothetical protein